MSEALALPGPRLKAEREKRGFSAERVANELHLDPWVVDALEAADYPRVGPAVFVKGHLKRYAELLGLPVAEIVASFEASGGAPSNVVSSSIAPSYGVVVPALHEGAVLNNWSPLQIIGCLLLLPAAAGVLWWKPWQHRNSTAEVSAAARPAAMAPTGADASSPAGASTLPAATNIPVPGAMAPAPASDMAAAGSAAGHARLKLSFASTSWVDIRDAEGRRVFSGTGAASSVKSVAAAAPLHVFLGAANDVQLEINDHAVAIGQQFYTGKTARFEAGADGVLRPESNAAPVPSKSRGGPNGPSHPGRPPG
jgi:cytoskeleton protein RodZ